MYYLQLDSTFQPFAQAEEKKRIQFEIFTFSGGEPHIKIQTSLSENASVMISHRIQSFNDLGVLLVTVDALRRMSVRDISLFLPYFPGARQDRVMVPGEPLTTKVYADIINNLALKKVIILDPHSDVTPALLNKCVVITNLDFAQAITTDIKDITLVSPDAGAAKKVHFLAGKLNLPYISCSKKRDVATGRLSGFQVHSDDLKGQDLLIIDDICDGGRTFLGLAEALQKKNAGKIYLAVTHGIFSKGTQTLLGHFETIFTTDSWRRTSNDSLTIKKIQL